MSTVAAVTVGYVIGAAIAYAVQRRSIRELEYQVRTWRARHDIDRETAARLIRRAQENR